MAFTKGKQKTGGRKKGTPNQSTAEARLLLTKVLSNEIEAIPDLLAQIENPVQKLNALTKLLPYFLPKLNNVDINNAVEQPSIIINLSENIKPNDIDIPENSNVTINPQQPTVYILPEDGVSDEIL